MWLSIDAMGNYEFEEKNRAEDAHERERQSLFGNESFAIGALQTVSAATSVGIISQLGPLQGLTSPFHVKLALTGTVVALIASILAAFFRHEYKKWDLKARAAPDEEIFNARAGRSKGYLLAMRGLMWLATLSVVGALSSLVAGLWLK